MGMSLQIRESMLELLFSDKYSTDDTEVLVRDRFEKPRWDELYDTIENPLFGKITSLMGVSFDNDELRDLFFSFKEGEGCVFIFPFKETEYFLALDLHREKLGDVDTVTLAVYCDARKYVKMKELFELLYENCTLTWDQEITDSPLVKAVLESDGKRIFYRGRWIPAATDEQKAKVCPKEYMNRLLKGL